MNVQRLLLMPCLFVAASLGARADILYTIAESSDNLCTIDTSTGVLTPIGPLGVTFAFGDLAYDTSTGTMYMTNGWGTNPSQLYTVNLSTGAATLVGSTGFNSIFGLAYDPANNKLYGSVSTDNPNAVFEINRATGAASVLGDPGVWLDGMTYVGSTNALVGLFAGPGSLHEVSTVNGSSTLLTSGGGFVNNCGIAWSSNSNQIFSIDWSGELYSFDVANSYARQTLYSGLGPCDGLASTAAGGCPAAIAYCTAGTTSHGCVPAISGTGTPSAAATSGFTISIANVEGQKSGIIFYGASGQLATPWALGSSSFLCVKPPTQRTLTQNSGGTVNLCNGTLSIDWLAYMAANPTALGNPLSSGQVFNAQGWFRDPPAVKTTNLSDGLQWTMCP